MTVPAEFDARWEQKLVALTIVISLIMLGAAGLVTWLGLLRGQPMTLRLMLLSSAVIPFVAFVLGALLSPRGFVIRESDLVIERWAGPISIPLSSIQSVERLPAEKLSGSTRTLGSEGFFGYYGRFRNQKLGSYRMYATRSDGYVLVRADRPYVLTPDFPDRFIDGLNEQRGARR
jgi:hypothetical protein